MGHKWATDQVTIQNIGNDTIRFAISGTNSARCKQIASALTSIMSFDGFKTLVLVNDTVLAGTDGGYDRMIQSCEKTQYSNTVGVLMGADAEATGELAGYAMVGIEKPPAAPEKVTPPPPADTSAVSPDVGSNSGDPAAPTDPATPDVPDTPEYPTAVSPDEGSTPVTPVDPGTPSVQVDPVSPVPPVDTVDPAIPVQPVEPAIIAHDPKGNNGHGNDADGNDDSNPGKSNDPDDHTDDDGTPGKSGQNGNGNSVAAQDETPFGRAKTYVTLMMDQSDMSGQSKKDKVDALNAYIASMQDSGEDVEITLIYYNSSMTENDVDKNNNGSFFNATTHGLNADNASGTRSVVAIQADGAVNISGSDTATLNKMIADRETQGWQFNFMGSNAGSQAQSFGISSDNTIVYTGAGESRLELTA